MYKKSYAKALHRWYYIYEPSTRISNDEMPL